jgi:Restriction endonuclease BglII
MTISSFPKVVQDNYHIQEVHHATAILECDFPIEYEELISVLTEFRLFRTEVKKPGGGRSPVALRLDRAFQKLGWKEHQYQTLIQVDETKRDKPTHKVDNVKGRIAIDPEWNNKDPFFDRDLNNFRTLFERGALSVGIIITRGSELQALFKKLGKGKSYGNSTTHWSKLIPRLEGDSAGGCPVLCFGIKNSLYVDDVKTPALFVDRYWHPGEKDEWEIKEAKKKKKQQEEDDDD